MNKPLIDVNLREHDDEGESGLYRQELDINFKRTHEEAVKAVNYLKEGYLSEKKTGWARVSGHILDNGILYTLASIPVMGAGIGTALGIQNWNEQMSFGYNLTEVVKDGCFGGLAAIVLSAIAVCAGADLVGSDNNKSNPANPNSTDSDDAGEDGGPGAE